MGPKTEMHEPPLLCSKHNGVSSWERDPLVACLTLAVQSRHTSTAAIFEFVSAERANSFFARRPCWLPLWEAGAQNIDHGSHT